MGVVYYSYSYEYLENKSIREKVKNGKELIKYLSNKI